MHELPQEIERNRETYTRIRDDMEKVINEKLVMMANLYNISISIAKYITSDVVYQYCIWNNNDMYYGCIMKFAFVICNELMISSVFIPLCFEYPCWYWTSSDDR